MAKILNISGTEITDRGIQKLASYISDNLSDDYTLVIGCKPSIYDVDAVLIGGGNIFAIECKDWKGKITGGSYGWWQKDGQVIDNPLHQTRNNAAALGRWLRDKLNISKGLWVQGLVLFTNEDCTLQFNIDKTSNTGVSIMHISSLNNWVSELKENKQNTNLDDTVVEYFSAYGDDNKKTYDEKVGLDIASLVSIFIVAILMITILFSINNTAGLISLILFLLSLPLFKLMVNNENSIITTKSMQETLDSEYPDNEKKFEIRQYNLDEDVYYDPAMKDLYCNIFHKDE